MKVIEDFVGVWKIQCGIKGRYDGTREFFKNETVFVFVVADVVFRIKPSFPALLTPSYTFRFGTGYLSHRRDKKRKAVTNKLTKDKRKGK